ncbi:hypothetical protein GCE86_19670 [Micromonospora terminaliae]|uniref:Uncharacterized protein n=1 Tax=Micromonospora terminaliae TaxID=1914461 RepID=A0AAJ2ZHD0_9ACTN|nr:hypothetical protein [Micromonospora terminaliae]NES28949.1 hypothetical protein [Micromonospora terminaliae]QGL49032.1 hypothetical protein GCE86_19670 [Micromonospora terminaliae]
MADLMSITEAAESGDMRALLVALRGRLAAAVDNPTTSARDLTALSRLLREIVQEIEHLDAREPRRLALVPSDRVFDASAL